ncbi:protein kinase domain-containing protein, partial [Toxoplasma gondii FOU]
MARNDFVDVAPRSRQAHFEILSRGSLPSPFSCSLLQPSTSSADSMTEAAISLSGSPPTGGPTRSAAKPQRLFLSASLNATGTAPFVCSSYTPSRVSGEEKRTRVGAREASTRPETEGEREKRLQQDAEANARTERPRKGDRHGREGGNIKDDRKVKGRDREDAGERRIRSCPSSYSSAHCLPGMITGGGSRSLTSPAGNWPRTSRTAKETRAQLTQLFNEFAERRPCRTSGSGPPLMHFIRHTCGGCRTGKVLDKTALLCLFSHLPAMVFERFFDLLDEDGDERVDRKEFCKGLDTLCSQDEGKLLRFLFNLCDLDGNGLIERDELRTLLYHLPFRLWKFSRRGRRIGRGRRRSRERRRERRASSLPSPSLHRRGETADAQPRVDAEEFAGEDSAPERGLCFSETSRPRGRPRRLSVPETERPPLTHFAPRHRAQYFDAAFSGGEESSISCAFSSTLPSSVSSSSEDEEEDSLRFDEKDLLVQKRIDEIVEAAFRHKQRNPDRDFRTLFSSSHAVKIHRGKERSSPHLVQPLHNEEGLTFEEFLAALEQNKEIHDLLRFFYIQSVLSLCAPRGPPLTLPFSFPTLLKTSAASSPLPSPAPSRQSPGSDRPASPHSADVEAPLASPTSAALLPAEVPSSPHSLPLVAPAFPPGLASLSSSSRSASPPVWRRSPVIAEGEGASDGLHLSLSDAVPSLPRSLSLPFRREQTEFMPCSGDPRHSQRIDRGSSRTSLPPQSSSPSPHSSPSSCSYTKLSSSSHSSSSSSATSAARSGEGEGDDEATKHEASPGSFVRVDGEVEERRPKGERGQGETVGNEKRPGSLRRLLTFTRPQRSAAQGQENYRKRSPSLPPDLTLQEGESKHLRRGTRFFSLFSPSRSPPVSSASASPWKGAKVERTSSGEAARRDHSATPGVRTPQERGDRGGRGDGENGTEIKREQEREKRQEKASEGRGGGGEGDTRFAVTAALPALLELPDPPSNPRFPLAPSSDLCVLSSTLPQSNCFSGGNPAMKWQCLSTLPSPSSRPPVVTQETTNDEIQYSSSSSCSSSASSSSASSSSASSSSAASSSAASSARKVASGEARTPHVSSSPSPDSLSASSSPLDSCSLVLPLAPSLLPGERRRRRSLSRGYLFPFSSVYEAGRREMRRFAPPGQAREISESEEETAEETQAEEQARRAERRRDAGDTQWRAEGVARQMGEEEERRVGDEREERRGGREEEGEGDQGRRGAGEAREEVRGGQHGRAREGESASRRGSLSVRLSKGRTAMGAAFTEGARALLSRLRLSSVDRNREAYLLNFLDADEELQMHGWLWKIGQHFGAWVRRYYFLTGKHLWCKLGSLFEEFEFS